MWIRQTTQETSRGSGFTLSRAWKSTRVRLALGACAALLWSAPVSAQQSSQSSLEAYERCITAFKELSEAVIAADLPARFEACPGPTMIDAKNAEIAALNQKVREMDARAVQALERMGAAEAEIARLSTAPPESPRQLAALTTRVHAAETRAEELSQKLARIQAEQSAAGAVVEDTATQITGLEEQVVQWRGAYLDRLGASIAATPDLGICALRLSTDGAIIMIEGAAQSPGKVAERLQELLAADQLDVEGDSRMTSDACAPALAPGDTPPGTSGAAAAPDMTLAASLDASGRPILYDNADARLELTRANALGEQECRMHAADVCAALRAPDIPGFWVSIARAENTYTALCACDGQIDVEGRARARGALVTRVAASP